MQLAEDAHAKVSLGDAAEVIRKYDFQRQSWTAGPDAQTHKASTAPKGLSAIGTPQTLSYFINVLPNVRQIFRQSVATLDNAPFMALSPAPLAIMASINTMLFQLVVTKFRYFLPNGPCKPLIPCRLGRYRRRKEKKENVF